MYNHLVGIICALEIRSDFNTTILECKKLRRFAPIEIMEQWVDRKSKTFNYYRGDP